MQQLSRTVLVLLACGVAGWLLWNKVHPGSLPGGLNWNRGPNNTEVADRPETIRIASFNIQVFGENKLNKPGVMNVIVEVVRDHAIVAIQEVRCESQSLLPLFVQMLNAQGRKYDYAIGPRLGRTSSKEQYAFVFDTQQVEMDRRYVYTVHDRGDRLHREPFVAKFRARGPPPEEAFTFTLVNVHTDPDEVAQELDALESVLRAVSDADPSEDDVILLGDLNASSRQLGRLSRMPGLVAAIGEAKTNTRQTKQYDNILFHREATCEHTGRGGIVDLMRVFKLDLKQALEVSDHLPIWAEFSVYEGGHLSDVARRGTQQR
jgi:endonuclease/exonuclease/phosphatase family metal-dependent hydrolase